MFCVFQSQQNEISSNDDELMQALDPAERQQFNEMKPQNEYLLKLIEERNRKRDELNNAKECFSEEIMIAELDERKNTVQTLAEQIKALKENQSNKSN